MFIEQQISILDCSNDAENTALITEINCSLSDIHIENGSFEYNIFTVLLYFHQ